MGKGFPVWMSLGVLTACFGCATTPPPGGQKKPFIVVAHRGVVTDALTENSLASLEETIRRGYTHIEVDVRSTKDGYPICLHDGNLRRTTGISKPLGSLTLEQLRELVDAETVPDLETFCQRCAGRIALMPDVKGGPRSVTKVFTRRLRATLEQHDLMDSALFIGSPGIGQRFAGEARVAWRDPLEKARNHPRARKNPGRDYFVFGHGDDFDQEAVDGFHAMGLDVIVSINVFHYDESDDPIQAGFTHVHEMIALGVDGLQIDSVYDEPALAHARAVADGTR
ncbi:MAG: glycerophosphodiester phosphodiesterase family protein [bacterium]|nr:glycerophosphodiester phosphodiesterase family protein [bacterium]